MKIERLKRGLFCAFVAGVLFTVAYRLVGGFGRTDTIGSAVGVGILLVGCWALAESTWNRWRTPRKKESELDTYTAALVEMELEKQKAQPNPSIDTTHGQ